MSDLDPRNNAIIHTQAEIDRRRANEEDSQILKETLRRRARARLNEMPPNDRFAVSSRCKLLVDEVFELSRALAHDAIQHEALFFADKVKDAEDLLARAQQQFPDDPTSSRSRLTSETSSIRKTAPSRPWSAHGKPDREAPERLYVLPGSIKPGPTR